jgi:hypothetical protein
VPRRQQQERVDVGDPVPAGAPVQAGGRAARMAGGEHAEDGAARHRRADRHGRRHGFVGRAQPVGVLHRDHPAACQHAGEHDDALGGGEHRGPRCAGQVDAAVARTEPVGRLLERPDDGRDGGPERPAVPGARHDRPHRVRLRGRRSSGGGPRHPRRSRQDRADERDEHRDQRRARARSTSSPSRRRVRCRGAGCPIHAVTLPRRGRSGRTFRSAVDGCSPMWTTAGRDRMRQRERGARGVCSTSHLDLRGDFARPRTPSDPGPGRPAGTVSGRSRGSQPGRLRAERVATGGSGLRRDARAVPPAGASRQPCARSGQGRAGPRGEHRPWPSSP